MSNIKNILAATDFSSASVQAVDRGFMLSHANHAKYSLIHALGSDMQQALLRVTGSSSSSAALCNSILEHTEAQMRELISQCSNGHGLEAALIIEPDSASRAISSAAKAKKPVFMQSSN
jgi:CPA2 family monovalent cation:H+ antiporter-2